MEELDYVPPKQSVSMGDMLKRYEVKTPVKKTRGGINGVLTEQRAIASKLLGLPIPRVGRMTSGWTGDQLFQLNKKAQSWKRNPPALWWKLYKEIKHGRPKNPRPSSARVVRQHRKEGGQEQRKEREQALLRDWQARSEDSMGESSETKKCCSKISGDK